MSTDKFQMDLEELIAASGGRPFVKSEIDQVHPQAVVDKTQEIPSSFEHEPTAGPVAAPRCNTCFGPMPCEKHANVVHLGMVTSNDIDPVSAIAAAHNADLEVVVIVGLRRDGREYFAASPSDSAEAMYHLQRGIYKLNKMIDELAGDEHDGEPERA